MSNSEGATEDKAQVLPAEGSALSPVDKQLSMPFKEVSMINAFHGSWGHK
jgi:hypothetical protein